MRVNREPVDALPAGRARERTGDGSAGVPWRGEVVASWNAALRRRPSEDPENPYEEILADLERGSFWE